MISCTEFIPSYSELFKYLDERYGYPEVQRFWSYLFKPDGKGIPLVNFVKKDGLRGAVEYWNGTLKEEAADVTRWFNEEEGWAYSEMHYCPSKGRLLKMKEELGVEPYAHYCDHCEYYRPALEMYGLRYYRNSLHVDEARCSSMIFDPKIFKGGMSMNGNTKKIEYRSGNLEYFHRDFHSSMNMGIQYLGENYGEEAVRDYLSLYARRVYAREIDDIRARGLEAIEAKIRDTYDKEHAPEVLTIHRTDDRLDVSIEHCPAVKHLRDTGREVTQWYPLTTSVVMEVFAGACGASFAMDSYDDATGAARYHFAINSSRAASAPRNSGGA